MDDDGAADYHDAAAGCPATGFSSSPSSKQKNSNNKRAKLSADDSSGTATKTAAATAKKQEDADRTHAKAVVDDDGVIGLWTDIPDPATHTCITVDPTASVPPSSSSSSSSRSNHHVRRQPNIRLENYESPSSSSLLQDLLYPLDAQTFLQRCWAQCAVHVKGGDGGGTAASTTTSTAAAAAATGRNGSGGGDAQQPPNTHASEAAAAAPPTATRFSRLVSDHLFDLDPLSILSATASDSVFVWLQTGSSHLNHRASTTNPAHRSSQHAPRRSSSSMIHSVEISDADDAYRLHRHGGHATYCRAPPALEQVLVSSLLRDAGLPVQANNNSNCSATGPLGSRGEVEVFLTPPSPSSLLTSSKNAAGNPSSGGGGVTGWHYDFQENFTLQLSGCKRWTLQKGTVRHPLPRGCTPHYNAPPVVESQLLAARLADPHFQFGAPPFVAGVSAVGEPQTVTLRPGDVLYFPAGMWHKVEVLEAPGVSINVSLIPANGASWTCQALHQLLVQRPEWRRAVRHLPSASVVEQLQGLLRDLPGIIREFEESGGAQAVVPPVLYMNNDNTVAKSNVDTEEDDDDDDDDEEDESEPLIRVSEFVHPSPPFTARHRLLRNPLALLLSEPNEIQRFYGRNGGKNDPTDDNKNEKSKEEGHGGESDNNNNNDDKDEEVFVLNISYAGNEAHESLVRVRLSADPREVEALERALNANDCTVNHDTSSWAEFYEQHRALVDCLHFYGYVLWKESE